MKLENIVKFAKIIEENKTNKDVISVGSKVTVLDIEFNEEDTYSIVGSTEADPYESKISNVSPLGSSLIGKRVGETVVVQVPTGVVNYKVVKIV